MRDQMEIVPNIYESSPQPTSHPLFAHREPPASLSSTKPFSHDGAWFTPVAHTDGLPTIAQYALDLLCCPVISAECKRVFSGAKLLTSPNRNRLADDIIEAAECFRIW